MGKSVFEGVCWGVGRHVITAVLADSPVVRMRLVAAHTPVGTFSTAEATPGRGGVAWVIGGLGLGLGLALKCVFKSTNRRCVTRPYESVLVGLRMSTM